MSSKNSQTKATRIAKYRAMITGVEANVAPTAAIGVGGTAITQPVVVSTLQGYADATGEVATTLAAYRQAVAKQKAAGLAAEATYLDVREYALNTYGQQPSVLGTFGLTVPVRKTPSAETKAAAAAKRAAKRKATAAAGTQTTAETPAPAATGNGATTPTKA